MFCLYTYSAFTWMAAVMFWVGLSVWAWGERGTTERSYLTCVVLWGVLSLGVGVLVGAGEWVLQ